MRKLTALAAALTATALLLTGCGGSGGSAADDHNEDDVAFATQMIPHHAQALQMADMTIGKAGTSDGLGKLADQIRAAQQPEIDQMAGWLKEWGEEVPQTGYGTGDEHSHHEGMDGMDGDSGDMNGMGGMDGMDGVAAGGMMSGDDMAALADAKGKAFERLWLTMMIEHHRGAVSMALDEVEQGDSAEAKALAKRVVSTQQDEIAQMRTMLEDLG